MDGQPDRLSNVRLQHNMRPVETHARLSAWAIGGDLLLENRVKISSPPSRFREQPVDICKRLDTAFDGPLETFGRIGLGKTHGCQHRRQHVLGPMLSLPREYHNLSFMTLALGNVAGNFRRANGLACRVLDRGDRQRNIDWSSIFSDADRFLMVDAFTAAEAFENGRLFMPTFWRNQNRYMSSDDFLRQISKYPLGAFVPSSDNAVEILADDCIVA